jgi:hypothetical protein
MVHTLPLDFCRLIALLAFLNAPHLARSSIVSAEFDLYQNRGHYASFKSSHNSTHSSNRELGTGDRDAPLTMQLSS